MSLNRHTLNLILIVLSGLPQQLMGSPWLEADDVYLRANIQTLVEAGLLRIPINSFPILWNMIAEDLSTINLDALSPGLEHAYDYIKHHYDNAALGIGTRRLKATYGNDQAHYNSYGPIMRERMGALISFEQTLGNVSGRASYSYARGTDNTWKHNLLEGYAALGVGDFVASYNMVDRFWGVGWHYGFGWSQQPEPVPALELDYYYDKKLLGVGNLQLLIARLDPLDSQGYLLAGRYATRLNRYLEFGLSHKYTFGKESVPSILGAMVHLDDVNHLQQSTADLRLSHAITANNTLSLYGELATTSDKFRVGSYLSGLDGQIYLGENSIRWFGEYNKLLEPYHNNATIERAFVEYKSRSLTDSKVATGLSLGILVQLKNDQKFRYIHTETDDYRDDGIIYAFYIEKAEINFGLGYTNESTANSYSNGWLSIDYRF